MIELLFIACLSTAPDTCMERSLVYTDISPRTCLLGAQPELAKWQMAHPRYAIARWSCRSVLGNEVDA